MLTYSVKSVNLFGTVDCELFAGTSAPTSICTFAAGQEIRIRIDTHILVEDWLNGFLKTFKLNHY